MTPIQLIMPMAGRGSRFSGERFQLPKPMIKIHGKPFFWWAVRSIEKYVPCGGITFVILEEHIRDFKMDEEILQYFPEARIKALPEVTEGAAITALRGVEGIDNCEPVLFNDCDHLFRCTPFQEYCAGLEKMSGTRIAGAVPAGNSHCGISNGIDGALLTFESDSPAYSYLLYGEDGTVTGTVEKQVVSRDAICGAYYFRSRAVFENACADYLMNCAYREYFLSGVYNALLASGGTVSGFRTDFHVPFGTPEEYAKASVPEYDSCFEALL